MVAPSSRNVFVKDSSVGVLCPSLTESLESS
jgi:hypothetical protein